MFTERELKLLEEYESAGIRPIAPSTAAGFFELFLENYSCAQIAKHSKVYTESDILYCAKKFNWHEQRDKYAIELQNQIQQKLAKQKLESLEYLTNLIAVAHKENNEQMLKYLQSGKKEDLPDNNIKSLGAYKQVIEMLQKVTGEDRVSKQEIKKEVKTTFDFKNANEAIDDKSHSKLLKLLASKEDSDDKQD